MDPNYDFLNIKPTEEHPLQDLIPLGYRDIMHIPEEGWAEALRRREIIRPLLEGAIASTFKEVSATSGVPERTLRRWTKKFLNSGKRMESLFDRSLVAIHTGSPLDPVVNHIIVEELEKWVNNQNRIPRIDVVRTIRGKCRELDKPQPSQATIYRRMAAIPPGDITRGQHGRRAWELEFRQSNGEAPRGSYPMELVEGDHALADIEVRSEDRIHVLGRPWITALMDVYSACILALIIQMDRPGLGEVGYAIGMAVLPKAPVILRLGLNFAWPCQGLISRIHVDNAFELSQSPNLIRSLSFYGIDHQSRLSGVPESGPHIERFFRELQREMHRLPGTTFSDPASRGDYPSEAKATFTFSEFEHYLFRWVLGTYHQTPSQALGGFTPLQKWRMGVEGTPEIPGTGDLPMPQDPQRFFLDFLPATERQVQPEGIRLRNLWYQSDALKALVGLQDPENPKLPMKVLVRTDPVDLSRVFVLDPRINAYLVVPLRTLGRPAISLREHQVIQKSIRERLNSPVTEELIFREREYLRAVVESSVKQTKRAKVIHQRTRRLLHQTKPLHIGRLPLTPQPGVPLTELEGQLLNDYEGAKASSEVPVQTDQAQPEWPDDFGISEEDL